jgi:hypothetical protein
VSLKVRRRNGRGRQLAVQRFRKINSIIQVRRPVANQAAVFSEYKDLKLLLKPQQNNQLKGQPVKSEIES